ncbi:transposable element Tcb2 transposase [Trichonephila clavipes]|uniref:Transposable element Tcb2 transposase n=1 Tax=Trichonephila clavipes TaxID=2585209 RepID=A0A8X6SDL5_TRICX|nr:transposable element Tcb2 transposase [Trichonephila clavipes]
MGRQVSWFTVARHLHKGGIFVRRSERCLPLKVDHRRHRLQWRREHKNWTFNQWSHVLFTDESRFSTRSDSQRVLICREIGTRFYTSNIKERHHYGGPGFLVWGGIMLNGETELHIFDRGSVIGDRYCEEVLLPHVCLFRGDIGPDFIFMDDNARTHRTIAVEDLLESENITRMDWPAYSPDLNPIEHVWDALGRRIAARSHHPENTHQLKQILIEEWVLLPCQVIYSQFGLAIHQNDHQARRRFVEWAQNEIAVVPDLHKRILFSDEAHFWLNGYVNKQNCRIWSEANPQVYVETPLHPEKLTVWCALWAGGILLQKR